MHVMQPQDARQRVVIEGVDPEIDGGRFPIKRTRGETVTVEADIFTHGQTELACTLLHRQEGETVWQRSEMQPLGNDRWRATFEIVGLRPYIYTLQAAIDPFAGWRLDLEKRIAAGQDVEIELLIGAELVAEAAARATGIDGERLAEAAQRLAREKAAESGRTLALSPELAALMRANVDLSEATCYEHLRVMVDRERARSGAWYEMFPRSTGPDGRHGSFRDCEERLSYVAEMGFDILYLPPVHPIGTAHRKGRNNNPVGQPGDIGSPWAIGSEHGGHTAIEPQLGTLEDFRHLLQRAADFGLEVALDIAFQCSPDHPWVREHPQWFRHRPDGSIQYAENPPKKYEDIYPLDFETEDWQALWQVLRDVFVFWAEQGVRIFRVDNPHTKPFAFWEWAIADIRSHYPDVIFLAEAFTRPKIMYRLAKLGFDQSYNYFPWRNQKWELTQYFTELTQTRVREFFRPNLWTNTPDILTEYLQTGGRPGFIVRLVLASTLGASYGIYGPAFELLEHQPRDQGSEEYLDSEKYELKQWDIERPDSLRNVIARINRARHANPALQTDRRLAFHTIENDNLIAYSKTAGTNAVLTIVNLDPHNTQTGWLHLDLAALGLEEGRAVELTDVLTEARHTWQTAHQQVEIDPQVTPAHVFEMRPQE